MANQKLNTTITIGAVLGTKTSRTFGVLKGGLSQINKSIKDVTRRQKEIGRERSALLKAGKSVAHLDREYEKLEGQLKQLTVQQNRWTRAIGRTKEVGRTFGRMKTQLTGAFRAGAIAATIYGGAVFGVAKSTAALGDEVAKTADKLGIGTAELQELRYAGERAGLSVSDIDKSLEKMQKNLGEAMTGTGAAKDALDQLGLSAADLTKMKPEEALGLIADKMQGVGTQAERAAIANDIFGRSGIGMLNMLRDGSAGLTQLREDARKTGYVMSEEAARQSEAFNDALLDAELSAKGVKNTIGAALLPVTTGLMKQFSSWVQNNNSQIKTWGNSFGEFAERALPVLKDVVVGVGRISTKLWGTISLVSDMVGGWQNFGMIIGGVFAAKTILSVGAFVGSVFKLGTALLSITKFAPLVAGALRAIGVAAAANPIGILITVVAGGAYLIYRNWESISTWFVQKWEQVKPAFSNAWAGIKSIFLNYTPHGLIIQHWDSIASWFTGLWGRVKSATSTAWAGIKSGFLNYTPHGLIIKHWDSIATWFTGLWDRVKTGVSLGWEGIKSSLLTYHPAAIIYNNWNGISTWFSQKWDQVKTTFSNKWTAIKTTTANWATDFLAIGGNIIDSLKSGITAKVEGVISSISNVGSRIVSTFKSILGINSPSTVFSDFGGWIMDGLKNGIMAKFKALKETITNVASSAASWFKKKLGINSPSRVFMGFGNNVSEGLAIGIREKENQVVSSVSGLNSSVTSGFGKPVLDVLPRIANAGDMSARADQFEKLAMRTTPSFAPTSSSSTHHTEQNHNTYQFYVQATSGQQAHEVVEELKRQTRATRSGRLFDQNSLRVG